MVLAANKVGGVATVFLIGGTGNQLFQYSRSKGQDRFSYAFLDGLLPKILGWTRHERLFDFPKASLLSEIAAIIIVPCDLLLGKLFGRTLLTSLDLKVVRAEPLLTRAYGLGYFQRQTASRNVMELANQLAGGEVSEKSGRHVCMHVRGGDVLAMEAAGENPYGVLKTRYYREALSGLQPGSEITVFTNDERYAKQIIDSLADLRLRFEVDDGDLASMVSGCLKAEIFVASNSTLSYWIAELRGPGKTTYSPQPFTKSLDLVSPPAAKLIRVSFDS